MKGFLSIAGALLAGVVLGFLVWGFRTGQDDGLEVLKAKAAVAKAQDERKAGALKNAGVSRRVDCYVALIEAFDPATGKSRVWVAEYTGGYVECFDGPGFSRRTGEPPPELPGSRQAWGRPPRRAARRPELHEIQELDCREVGCN